MLNLFFSNKITRFSASFLLAASIALLAGCGGGGGGTTTAAVATGTTAATATQTITGTVATGAPLAGATITVKDSAGKTATGTSTAAGTFSVAVTGMTPPFMLAATKAGQQNMYSFLPAMDMAATNTQNVNITPVTTLVMYELNGGTDPASMYNGGTFSTVTAANVSAKQTIVRSKLPANTVNPIFDMMYGNFVASVTVPPAVNADPYDKALDGIGKITAITAASVTLTPTVGAATTYTPAAAGATVGAAAAPSIALSLTDTTAPFAARTSIASSSPARITATVKNANGAAVANAIVTFTASDPRDTFSGGANTALTDINGVATVTLTTSNTAGGASTVTASSTVNATAVTNSLNYAVGSSTITLSALTLPAAALSAYGTASVSVNVLNNGVAYTTPMTVSFTSGCASSGKATLTASVTTVNGTATASYLDNGCNNAAPGDNITATLMNGVTATGNLAVNSPAIGSIQFVSVETNPVTTPTMITLKGTGGTSRSETARVVFRVVDSAGNPLGNALVNFSLNTALGGLALSSTSATSDPATGNVVTNVLAGTMSTAVRVTATTGALSTQSDQLVVSTGIPAQDAFSLGASAHNIEGWSYEGTPVTLTARLADHFHNPVPDGTAVYFTTEGGVVIPSCTTVGGVCSSVWSSQNPRPADGRSTVLVRAVGEEAFIDLNSNGVADPGDMIDINNASTDMGEAYVDYNENGIRDAATEPYIDFNGNAVYDGTTTGAGGLGGTATGDGKYNGVLCNATATPAFCSTQKSIDVRGSQVIIFSDSWGALPASLLSIYDPSGALLVAYNTALGAYNTALGAYNTQCAISAAACTAAQAAYDTAVGAYNTAVALYTPPPIGLPTPAYPAAGLLVPARGIVLSSCTTVTGATQNTPATVTVTVVDTNGNAMPAGTTVAFSTSNGTIPTPASWTVPDTIGCRTGFAGCPASAASPTFGDISVSLVSSATFSTLLGCGNNQSGGIFTVTVTSPKGSITTYTMGITD